MFIHPARVFKKPSFIIPYRVDLRHYYAAIFEGLEKVPSRISMNEMGYPVLQTFTRGDLIHGGGRNTWRRMLFGKEWDTILSYEQGGYGLYSFSRYEYETFFSHSRPRSIPLTLLYAVPQPIWENFTKMLAHQEIVAALNLNQHRHLWQAYNYIMSTDFPDLSLKRATLIGKYHFLLSILLFGEREKIVRMINFPRAMNSGGYSTLVPYCEIEQNYDRFTTDIHRGGGLLCPARY